MHDEAPQAWPRACIEVRRVLAARLLHLGAAPDPTSLGAVAALVGALGALHVVVLRRGRRATLPR